MSEPAREMSLDEWMATLPASHRAARELSIERQEAAAAERRGMERAARLACVHCANGEPLEPASPGVDTLYQHPCDAKDCGLGGGPHPCDADLILDALAAEEDDQ